MKIRNVESREEGTGEITMEYAEQVFKELLAFQGYGFCLGYDVPVVERMQGVIPIGRLKVGDCVLTPGDKWGERWSEVKNVIIQGNKDVYEVVFSNGEFLHVTLDHPILCEDGNIRSTAQILDLYAKEKPCNVMFRNNRPERITCVKFIGNLPVIDIEIDSRDHLFYANGCIVHNCKAHATSYSVYSAVQMYLQEHYFIEYMCALLNHVDRADEKKDVGVLNERVEYCVKNGLMIKYPNVNTSSGKWQIVGGSLLAPLKNIKGFSDREVSIIEEGRPYSGFKDFMKKTGFNENRFLALLYSNSLSDFGTIDDLYNQYKNQFVNECTQEKEISKKKEKLEKDYLRAIERKRSELEKRSKKELERIDSAIEGIKYSSLFGDDSGLIELEKKRNSIAVENNRILDEFQKEKKKEFDDAITALMESKDESQSSGIAYPQTIHDQNDLFEKCMDYNGFVIPDNIKIKYHEFFEKGMKYVAEYKHNEEYGRRNSRIYSLAEIRDEPPEEDRWKNCWILAKVISEARGISGKFGTFDKIVISDGKDKETIIAGGIPSSFKKGNVMVFPVSINCKGKMYIDTRTLERLDPVILE